VVLGSGGHTAQMLRLVDLLGNRFEYIYLVGKGDNLSAEKISQKGEVCIVHRARDHGDNVIVTFFKVIRLFWESLMVIRRTKPKVILSAGPGMAVPMSMLGKMLGKKVIFVESWSRVYKGSTSGKIIYRFADLFFVQWPEMKSVYSKGIYAGRVQ